MAVARSPERCSSRKATIETVSATESATASRCDVNESMQALRSWNRRAGCAARRKPLFPVRLIEARQFVRLRREREIAGERVDGRIGEQREEIGLLGDQFERLLIGLQTLVGVDRGVRFLQQLLDLGVV